MHRALVGLAVVLAMGVTPSPTPPPQIYHIVTRPLCSELHEHVAPAVGMLLQNDATIKKSPDLFKRYNAAALYGSGVSGGSQSPPAGDPGGGTSNPTQQLALQGMENLIRPIANNIIAIETMLDSPALMNGTGQPDDDKQLQDIRAKLLKALAAQNASLDIISGFVDTQQMADLQHADEGYINSVSKPDINDAGMSSPAPALNPLEANPNYAGLPPNPYDIDLATVPGLTMGYNPVTRLLEALHWTIDATATRENDAAKAVMTSASLCSSYLPHPSPTP